MKSIVPTLLFSLLTATAVHAGGVMLTLTDAETQTSSVSRCYVTFKAENQSSTDVNLEVHLKTHLKKGSMSAMIAPAGQAFGNRDVIRYSDIGAGQSQKVSEDILGVDCAEMTGLTIKVTCNNSAASCPFDISLSPNSVRPVRFEGGEPVGIEVLVPKGPMHGKWEIKDPQGHVVTMLDLSAPLDEDISGSFETFPAFCALGSKPEDCESGRSGGDELRSASHSGSRVRVGIRTVPDGAGQITFLWDFETGEGKVVNQAGTLNAAIRAAKLP